MKKIKYKKEASFSFFQCNEIKWNKFRPEANRIKANNGNK
jgi:hypothetical protein